MQQLYRRSPRHSSYWVMIIDQHTSAVFSYHLLKFAHNTPSERQLDSLCRRCIVRHLPPYMNVVLMAMFKKTIYCSCSLEILKNYIGRLSRAHSTAELMMMFNASEECFAYDCINTVTVCYCSLALDARDVSNIFPMSRDEFIAMLKKSRMLANEKQNKRRKAEMYLGRSTFENELCRSFDEFMRSIIIVFGFRPYKLEDIFPIR